MDLKKHTFRIGKDLEELDDLPEDTEALDEFVAKSRQRIEPWLSAVFQAEHLNLLLGSGFTTAIAYASGKPSLGMEKVEIESPYADAINEHAEASAQRMNRGAANIEDQLRSAIAVLEGLNVFNKEDATSLKSSLDNQIKSFLTALLNTEEGIATGQDEESHTKASAALQAFLLSFASRAASRERLHIFTTNYDRLIEHGCDLAGLRVIDRFVGALTPIFRASRLETDLHYNPPGIRGEPRYMEGVIRLTKLHGSLDWMYNQTERQIFRNGIPFGAPVDHTDIPTNPVDTVMIYPNAAKDVETTEYPYAELFRDFAAATCRPNAVLVTYGYGFGDDHINRVLLDMLSIPSTHLVIISYSNDDRLKHFLSKTRDSQVSLLLGTHFADLIMLVENYLPKSALDYITGRMTELLKRRPLAQPPAASEDITKAEGDSPF
ncbi:MAG: SIR2 family protein [Candidatus Thiodiazotropha endolucinida]|nr:SIR2 family protein [Candidatus Thiodiazotropha taylori]MCW4249209.1 SIR2 family protein [Candidatus Thiodiazotropha endolucinida]